MDEFAPLDCEDVMATAKKSSAKSVKQGTESKRGNVSKRVPLEVPPRFDVIALVAPKRRGRRVNDLEGVLKEASTRLTLAWNHKKVLDSALVQTPPFHAHAWSAVTALRADLKARRESFVSDTSLAGLQAAVGLVRKVVVRLTRPDDEARAAVLSSVRLSTRAGLVDEAEVILQGAKGLQTRFPALTDALLQRVEQAIRAARPKTEPALNEGAQRVHLAEAQQLAVDVLVDSMDQLAAAAMTTLQESHPQVAERLIQPLEVDGPKEEQEEPPAPSPTPSPAPNG